MYDASVRFEYSQIVQTSRRRMTMLDNVIKSLKLSRYSSANLINSYHISAYFRFLSHNVLKCPALFVLIRSFLKLQSFSVIRVVKKRVKYYFQSPTRVKGRRGRSGKYQETRCKAARALPSSTRASAMRLLSKQSCAACRCFLCSLHASGVMDPAEA